MDSPIKSGNDEGETQKQKSPPARGRLFSLVLVARLLIFGFGQIFEASKALINFCVFCFGKIFRRREVAVIETGYQ